IGVQQRAVLPVFPEIDRNEFKYAQVPQAGVGKTAVGFGINLPFLQKGAVVECTGMVIPFVVHKIIVAFVIYGIGVRARFVILAGMNGNEGIVKMIYRVLTFNRVLHPQGEIDLVVVQRGIGVVLNVYILEFRIPVVFQLASNAFTLLAQDVFVVVHTRIDQRLVLLHQVPDRRIGYAHIVFANRISLVWNGPIGDPHFFGTQGIDRKAYPRIEITFFLQVNPDRFGRQPGNGRIQYGGRFADVGAQGVLIPSFFDIDQVVDSQIGFEQAKHRSVRFLPDQGIALGADFLLVLLESFQFYLLDQGLVFIQVPCRFTALDEDPG